MHNAKGIAIKIHVRFAQRIARVCHNTHVPPEFLAGLIAVENPKLDPNACRFEKAVYEKLKQIRNPLVFWRRSWNGITQADLRGASDPALVNLATSFGYTQIMGWWSVPLKRTVAEIRDPFLHLAIAVQLIERNADHFLIDDEFEAVLRIWNSGSATGRTFDPEYVPHALAVMQQYAALPQLSISVSPQPTTRDAPSAPSCLASSKGVPSGQS